MLRNMESLESKILFHSYKICVNECESALKDISLADGLAGISIFLSNFYKSVDEDAVKNKIREINLRVITKAVKEINSQGTVLSLFGGLTGVGTACMEAMEYDEKYITLLTKITKAVVEKVNVVFEDPNIYTNLTFQIYDLFNGAVGISLFLSKVYKKGVDIPNLGKAIHCLTTFLIKVSVIDIKHFSESLLFLPADELPKSGDAQKLLPEGALLIGEAHGLAGILGCLGTIYKIFPSLYLKKHIQNILEFLHRIRDDSVLYPEYVLASKDNTPQVPHHKLNGGWCFGSLGTTYSILLSSESIRNGGWADQAKKDLKFLFDNWKYDIRSDSLIMCHGLASQIYIANVLNKIYDDLHLEKTITEMISFTVHSANWKNKYLFSDVAMSLKGEKRYERGILEGELGVSLVLNSVVSNIKWDADWVFLFG